MPYKKYSTKIENCQISMLFNSKVSARKRKPCASSDCFSVLSTITGSTIRFWLKINTWLDQMFWQINQKLMLISRENHIIWLQRFKSIATRSTTFGTPILVWYIFQNYHTRYLSYRVWVLGRTQYRGEWIHLKSQINEIYTIWHFVLCRPRKKFLKKKIVFRQSKGLVWRKISIKKQS